MANFDHRTVGEDRMSFYVFDDLRWQRRPQHSAEPRTGPNIYRYDTLVEAVSKFKELPTHMRTAIGIHLNAASELDIVHRFGEESVLVTDYMNLPAWRHNDAVNRVVGHICEILNIEWQLDRHLLGATVAIPSARFSGSIIPDSYMSDKELVPREPERYGAKIDPYTAINEVFCEEGGGWIPLREAQTQGISFENPHLLKVSRFNVCCKARPTDKMSRAWDDGLHHMDMSPLDLRILQEGYALRHGNQQEFDKTLDLLVSDLYQFAGEVDPYEYKDQGPDYESQVSATRDQLSRGDTGAIKAYLEDFLSDSHPEEETPFMVEASRLLARVKNLDGLERYRKPTLNQQMESAESRKSTPAHDTPSPEKVR